MRTDPGAKHYGQSGGQDADGKDDGQDAPAPWARVADATSGALFESGSFLNPEVLLHSRHNLGIREFVSGLNIDRALGERLGAGETLLEFQLASRSISLRVVGAPITKALAVNAAHSRT